MDVFTSFNLTSWLAAFFERITSTLRSNSLVVLIATGIFLIFVLLVRLLILFFRLKQKTVFLELIPPRNTEVASQTTEQFFAVVGALLRQRGWMDRITLKQPSIALEISSQKETGIRYIARVPEHVKESFLRSLRSYIPALQAKEVSDYATTKTEAESKTRVIELRLKGPTTIPKEVDLELHDPLSYLTNAMTQVEPDETLALQLILRPLNAASLRSSWGASALETAGELLMIPLLLLSEFVTGNNADFSRKKNNVKDSLKKSDLQFAASLRLLVVSNTKNLKGRERGLLSGLISFSHSNGQSLAIRRNYLGIVGQRVRKWRFSSRINNQNLLLSTADVGALYHFPYAKTIRTEDFLKSKSQELPAPLTLKNRENLDVVFGRNHYGNRFTPVGLTDDERSRHMYLIGQTGSGKSTAIYHMAAGDIEKGRGLAIVDPHGDLAEDLLAIVPESRINDVIYFNPFDIKYPIGINLLELPGDIEADELELEKELACESVISIFRRIFHKDEHVDAHRIEYILRNTIHTAFYAENPTIFTVYELLNDTKFQKQVIGKLTDENLRHFWKNEFGKAGDYQIVKMVSGVTAKIGRMLFSPIAKRILEQPKSTINFEDILNSKKALICNLAEGKLGEDTSQLLGTIVITKIHQAALRRSRKDIATRTPFYLFVDEFQNFATSSFTKLLSGGRKFGLRITVAEQSTAQQSDRSVVDVILANIGVVVCFRTASPIDEEMLLSQFAPLVKIGDIANLPRHKFYMRLAALEAEDPFSGETIPITAVKNPELIHRLIESSRDQHAIEYKNLEVSEATLKVMKKESKNDGVPSGKKLGLLNPEVAAADTNLDPSAG